jgi:two-component system, LytTR family, response regulator
MSLQTVIVDDEPLALDLLKLLLADHRDIEVVAQCQNGQEAIAWLQSKPVDLLFLDVQMPELGGFDVVEQVGLRHLPPTIFVTAYHEHAVRAFDVHAVDYLTKPVEPERLGMALERVRRKIAAETALMTNEQLTAVLDGLRGASSESKPYISRLLVKDGEKEILLSVEKIEWIEAADYYCCLHVSNRRYMLRESIADLNDKLDPRQFVRVHRSSIVNLDQIREIHRDGQTEGTVVLTDGQKLRMSRAGRQKLMEVGRT